MSVKFLMQKKMLCDVLLYFFLCIKGHDRCCNSILQMCTAVSTGLLCCSHSWASVYTDQSGKTGSGDWLDVKQVVL